MADKHPHYRGLTREKRVSGICAYAVEHGELKPPKYDVPLLVSLEALQKGVTSEYAW